jgi:hypothetical protein
LVPVKTVQAVAICPRWTWERGKNPSPEGGGEGGVVWAGRHRAVAMASRHAVGDAARRSFGKSVRIEAGIALWQGFTSIRLNRRRDGPGGCVNVPFVMC